MFFFFFQAEDGIRDADVTGVQTCALPISQCLDRQVGPCAAEHPLDERLVEVREVGPVDAGSGEDVHDLAGCDRAGCELAQRQLHVRWVGSPRAARSSASNLAIQIRMESKNSMSSR